MRSWCVGIQDPYLFSKLELFVCLLERNPVPVLVQCVMAAHRRSFIKINHVYWLMSSKAYYKRPSFVSGKKFYRYECLSGVKCTEGMTCGRRWVKRVLLGIEAVSWRPKLHQQCIDYLSRHFIPKENCVSAQCELATMGVIAWQVEIEVVGD